MLFALAAVVFVGSLLLLPWFGGDNFLLFSGRETDPRFVRDTVGCGGTGSGVVYVWDAVWVGAVAGVPYVGVGMLL